MKRTYIIIVSMLIPFSLFAQSYDEERVALGNFLVRMYENNPFEGVKIVSDYNHEYLVSAVMVKKKGTDTSMDRVAQVKSNRQVSQFLNAVITCETDSIIRTSKEVKNEKSVEQIIERIRENSLGFIKGMEILRTLERPDEYRCYLFFRIVEEMKPS